MRLPRTERTPRILALVAIAAVAAVAAGTWGLAAGAAGGTSDLWLHVQVDEQGERAARVRVNLPIRLVEKAVAMVPHEELAGGKIRLDQEEITVAELRQLWAELEASPDATFVEVDEEEQRVRMSKRGGYLLVETVDSGPGGERVDVRVPTEVVEALLSGKGDELDLGAAIRALAARGEGELVTVHDEGSRVRVWVDRLAEAR